MDEAMEHAEAPVTVPPATSLPRWASEYHRLAPGARSVTLITAGATPRPLPDDVADLADSPSTRRLAVDGTVERVEEAVRAAAASERVGWRLVLIGDEHLVLAGIGAAHAAGLIASELRAVVTAARRMRVYCPHCGSTSTVDGRPGAIVPCSGCRRRLRVRTHLSRRRGSYLGSDAGSKAHGSEGDGG